MPFSVSVPRAAPEKDDFLSTTSSPSFTSLHSQLSWTAASVIAHEYPNSYTALLAYGAATTVSIARVTGRDHFPSDVVIGSAMGWLIGRQIYKAHHDPELDTEAYGMFQRQKGDVEGVTLGSTYVPLDSWVYPALERLSSMGYIPSQIIGLRPWTRRECMRQIQEAEYFAQSLPSGFRHSCGHPATERRVQPRTTSLTIPLRSILFTRAMDAFPERLCATATILARPCGMITDARLMKATI